MLYRAVLFALGLLLAAAELRVSDGEVVVKEGVAYVEVDVSWRLSWRNETNWDAAWLTVKAPVGREGVPLKLAPAGHRVVDTRTPDELDPTFSVSEDSVGTCVPRRPHGRPRPRRLDPAAAARATKVRVARIGP